MVTQLPTVIKSDVESQGGSYAGYRGASECPRRRVDYVDETTGEILGSAPCGVKSCPACGPRLRARHIKHFTAVFEGSADLWSVTLTVDRAVGLSPAQTRRYIREEVWPGFRRALYDYYRVRGLDVAYLAATELDQQRVAHLHGLFRLPEATAPDTVRRFWFRHGGGAVSHIEPVPPASDPVAATVAYVVKAQFGPDWDRQPLLSSRGIGYNAEEHKEERRRHVPEERRYWKREGVTPDRLYERRRGRGRKRPRFEESRAAVRLDLGKRRTRWSDRVAGTPYAVRSTLDPGTGRVRYDVVRSATGEGAPIVLAEDVGGKQEAQLVIAEYARRSEP